MSRDSGDLLLHALQTQLYFRLTERAENNASNVNQYVLICLPVHRINRLLL